MKTFRYYILFTFIFVFTICCNNDAIPDNQQEESTPEQSEKPIEQNTNNCGAKVSPFVVIEFFTYEGCKNCAEADIIMNSLIKAAEAKSPRPKMVIVSHHISFWNGKQEWTDRFGFKLIDSLHGRYCKTLESQQYTPMIVFNGQLITVPDPQALQGNMNYFLHQEAEAGICIEPSGTVENNQLKINYSIAGNASDRVLNVILTESKLVSKVTAGDNKGKILIHDNVTRTYKTIVVKQSNGELTIDIPAEVNLANASVMAFIQDPRSLKITGATYGFHL